MLFLLSMITNIYTNVIQKNIYVYYIIHKINVIYCRNLKLNAEKKGNFMKKKLFILLLICINCTSICLAHKGRTDSSGGHYDYSTGEYHYHHGYSAHQHNNGVCPYENNSINSKVYTCINCKEEIEEDTEKCPKCGYQLKSSSNEKKKPMIVKISDMTEEEKKEWEEQVKLRQQEGLNRQQEEIERVNNSSNSIGKDNKKEKQETYSNIEYFIGFLIIILIIGYIVYKKRKKEKSTY